MKRFSIFSWLLVPRRSERGDLVGTIALLSFFALLTCVIFGGSSLHLSWLDIVIPPIDLAGLSAFLTPIIMHTVKGTIETKRGQQLPEA
jgi:hypothetical protein